MADHRAQHRAVDAGSLRAAELISHHNGEAPGGGPSALAKLRQAESSPSRKRLSAVALASVGAVGLTGAFVATTPAAAAPGPEQLDQATGGLATRLASVAATFALPAAEVASVAPAPSPQHRVTGADLAGVAARPAPAAPTSLAPVDMAVPGLAKVEHAAAAATGPAAARAVGAPVTQLGAGGVESELKRALAGQAAAKKVAARKEAARLGGASSSAAARAVSFARASLGKEYRWGAVGPNAFDCSGLTMAAFRAAGVSIPRTAAAQSQFGRSVSRSQLQPGDLVFFYSPVSHVGIYIGGGKIIHASTESEPVEIGRLDNEEWHNARRI